MGLVALVELPPELANRLAQDAPGFNAFPCAHSALLEEELAPRVEEVEAVVIGTAVRDPIQTVQRAFRLDPALSVIVLSDEDRRRSTVQALRFAAFIGTDVECDVIAADALFERIARAADRTRARRQHRRSVDLINAQLSNNPPLLGAVAEQILVHLTEYAPIGIVALDARGQVLSVNPEASRLLSMAERDLLGGKLDRVGNGSEWAALFDAAETGTSSRLIALQRGPAQILEVRATVLPGTQRAHLVVLQDVTDREHLRRDREEALQRAELASRLKDEFLATVSHELRTPLTSIVGWTRLLRGGQLSPAKAAAALETIDRNATAQTRLIEDLLDVSRIVTGKLRLDLAPMDLGTAVRDAVESQRPTALARNITLSLAIEAELPPIRGDAVRLQQLVWNLVSNAVKFTPPGGAVHVEVLRQGDSLEVRVRDNGPGIPDHALPFIFDAFRQADGGTTRVYGGLGLGLAVARRVAELHGGSVAAENLPARAGAVFVVRLPLETRQEASAALPPRPRESQPPIDGVGPALLEGVRLLVVDDDADARELIGMLLGEVHGAEVTLAVSAADARARLETGPLPQLIVSDIGMEGEDGYSLIRSLRAGNGPAAKLPAIALTAYARDEDKRQALAAGFNAHAVKPIAPEVLIALVKRLLGPVLESRA
jgi:signal transduction histidine kinase/CheY-like chemotaxis protein